MKILAFLAALSCAIAADLQAVETQPAGRSVHTSKTANAIPIPQKPDQYYQQLQQQIQAQPPQFQHVQFQQAPSQQAYPVQYVPSSVYQQQQPHPAMIIITQPQPISPQAMLSHAAQHLLSYFHTNPQARYQFLQGNYQPQLPQAQTQQAYVAQPQSAVPAYTYQVTAVQPQYQQTQNHPNQNSPPFVPSQQISPSPIQIQHQQQIPQQSVPQSATTSQESRYTPISQVQIPIIGPFGHSTNIPHIATLAQLATQKYLPQPLLRGTTPAIITGLENFTPEQQAQIKAQLQSGGPITPLRTSLPANFGAGLQQSLPGIKPTAAPQTQSTSPQEFPAEDEDKGSAQQVSQQISSSSNYNSGTGYGNQFNKG